MNYIYTLLLFVCFSSYSQNTFIGKIIDKESNEPVIGASIRILDSNNGTFSNENGEFQIILNGNNKSLTITHLAYNTVKLEITNNSSRIIILTPAVVSLPEITAGNPAINFINLVINKAIREKDEKHFYKSFYQKTSIGEGNYNKIHEMFFEMCWTTEGVQFWKPTKNRYAEKSKQRFTYKNFIYSSFLQSSIINKYYFFPLNTENPTDNYNYKIEKYINEGKIDEIVVIKCTPKKSIKSKTSFSGRLFIDTKNDILLNIKGVYDRPRNKKWKHDRVIEVSFEKVNNKPELKFIHIEDITTNVLTRKKSIERAWIYCISNIPKLSNGKAYKIDEIDDDLVFFENAPYVKNFWDNEIPIFHTNLEREIIEYFEKNGLFKGNL
jgi:hypothetical protein